jgi:beta-glucanase (GH16 family)
VYAVHWEPDRICWYLDDQLYSTVTPDDLRGNPWVFDHDFFLLLNVAVGGTFSVTADPSATFPQAMLVDYIRIYANHPAAEEAVAAVEAAGGQWLGRLRWRTTIDRARAARGRPGRLPRCGTDGRATHDQPP